MSNHERDSAIERALGSMHDALRVIANYGDCLHQDHPDPNAIVCQCPVCIAKRAVNTETDWRYMSNNEHRLPYNKREHAIVEAWRRYMKGIGSGTPDHKLSQILHGLEPTERDWLVATTVIQWLATNVGSTILEEAGFRYKP